ncbi:unnamed protein product [Dovyalis caffra]|uniref:Uncharacterized protein n=1 Tax=Dovyalis caffra TaxID=77055 RepID=A0AAV1RN97_9ROSI|nr:unnamed protein product [Dovyalis caffra]
MIQWTRMKLLNKKSSNTKLSRGELLLQVTLKDAEIQRLKDQMPQRINNLTDQVTVTDEEILSLKNQLSKRDEEIQKHEHELALKDKEILSLKNRLNEGHEEIRYLVHDLAVKDEKTQQLHYQLILKDDKIQRLGMVIDSAISDLSKAHNITDDHPDTIPAKKTVVVKLLGEEDIIGAHMSNTDASIRSYPE